MNTKRITWAALLAPLVVAGCLVSPGPRGEVTIAPMLPAIVVLDTEPYYVHQGYHYHYQDGGWYYAQSRNGPWASLPRDHYPKEVKYKGKEGGGEKDKKHDAEHQER